MVIQNSKLPKRKLRSLIISQKFRNLTFVVNVRIHNGTSGLILSSPVQIHSILMDRHMDTQTDICTDGHMDNRQTSVRTDIWTDRHLYGQIYGHAYLLTSIPSIQADISMHKHIDRHSFGQTYGRIYRQTSI